MDEAQQRRQAVLDELERIEENARYTSVTHFVSAQHLKWLHHWLLGPTPIVLGGFGTWTGLANASHISGALAGLAGIAGSLLSFWNFGDSRAKHHAAGAAYKSIEHDSRRVRLVDGPFGDVGVLRDRLEEIAVRYCRLNEASVHTSQFAFRRAHKLLASGVYRNTVDEVHARAIEDGRSRGSLPPSGDKVGD